ncbi:hypothetical protein V6N13_004579 [Hibiscus sabdariffa]
MVLNLWVLGDRVLSWFLDMLQDYDALGSGWSGIVNGILFAAIDNKFDVMWLLGLRWILHKSLAWYWISFSSTCIMISFSLHIFSFYYLHRPLAISQGIVVVEVAVGLSMGVEHVVLIMEEAMVMVGEEGGYGMENRGVEYN